MRFEKMSLFVMCRQVNLFLLFFSLQVSSGEIVHYKESQSARVINIANSYLRLPCRLLIHISQGYDNHDFVNGMASGHNIPITILKFQKFDVESYEIFESSNCDIILILSRYSQVPHQWLRMKLQDGKIMVLFESYTKPEIEKVIGTVWNNTKVVDAMMLAFDEYEIKFYDWRPYQADDCDGLKGIRLVDVWKPNDGKNQIPLNQTSPSNLHGCPIYVTTTVAVPYVTHGFEGGYEMKIMRILENYFNFSISFVDVPKSEVFWRTRNTDGSFQGAFKLLAYQNADIAFAGISATVERYQTALSLYPHNHEYMSWIFPTPKFLTPLQKYMRVFSLDLWLMVAGSLFGTSVIVYITGTQVISNYFDSLFYTFSVLCTCIPPFRAEEWPLRFVTFSLVIIAIHLFIYYQSIVIMMLSRDILGQPYSDVSEMFEAGLTCFLTSSQSYIFENDDRYYQNCQSVPIKDPLGQVAFNKSFLLFSRSAAKLLARSNFTDDAGQSLIYILREPFLSTPMSYYMSRGNGLYGMFNRKIQHIVESGILEHWKAWSEETDDAINEVYNKAEMKPLDMESMLPPFIILGFYLIICTSVFFVELFISFNRKGPITMKRH